MSLDRSALITAYRNAYGGGDIEAEQAVRAVELAYAEKQNAELITALDEADGHQVQAEAKARRLIKMYRTAWKGAYQRSRARGWAADRASKRLASVMEANQELLASSLGAQIDNQRLQAWMERIPQQHMRFGVTDSEGKTEMQECTDWCLACKLERLQAEITEARNACVWLAQIHGHYGPHGSILDHFQAGQYKEAIALIQTREQRRLSRTGRALIRIVAVEENHGRLDCCDEEAAHVWASVVTWNARRAYLTGASPFLNALREESGTENTPVDLLNTHFIAELPLDPPDDEPGAGEWLEWPGLKLAPSREETRKRLGIS